MNKERLLALADLLEGKGMFEGQAPQPENFDLKLWKTGCQTTACAVGHAATHPYFIEQGLTLSQCGLGWQPVYNGSSNWSAVGKFFDINRSHCEFLFHRVNYRDDIRTTPVQVAERIRQLVAERG